MAEERLAHHNQHRTESRGLSSAWVKGHTQPDTGIIL